MSHVDARDIEDTGQRRRLTDGVSHNDALELLAALAYEYALKNPDVQIEQVERAILRLRQEAMK
jgi:hypothetical protein